MPKPRNAENIVLPERWQIRHGAIYYRVPEGSERYWDNKTMFRLGTTIEEAELTFNEQFNKPHPDDELAIEGKEYLDSIAQRKHKFVIYFLYNGEEIVYIGKSSNPYARLNRHSNGRIMDFEKIAVLDVMAEEMDHLERLYIRKFKPKYNLYLA